MQKKAFTINTARINLLAKGMLLFFAWQLGLSYLYKTLRNGLQAKGVGEVPLYLLYTLAGFLLLVVPLAYFINQAGTVHLRIKLAPSRYPVQIILPFFVLGILLVNLALSALQQQLGAAENEGAFPTSAFAIILYYISSCVVPAFLEEFLFRGMVQGLLRPYGPFAAVLLSTIFFTCAHNGKLSMLGVFIVSLGLGAVYEICGALWPCILLHLLNNSLAFIMAASFFTVQQQGFILLGVVLAAFIGALLVCIFALLRKLPPVLVVREKIPVTKGLKAVVTQQPLLIVLLGCILLSIIRLFY